jgi:hypothetical protein
MPPARSNKRAAFAASALIAATQEINVAVSGLDIFDANAPIC